MVEHCASLLFLCPLSFSIFHSANDGSFESKETSRRMRIRVPFRRLGIVVNIGKNSNIRFLIDVV